MSTPRLILLDGLPGSGKTTTTQQLWLHLESLGHRARWWFEHELGHPVLDYGTAEAARKAGPAEFRFTLERAHANWSTLAQRLRAADDTTLLEATLFQTTLGSQLLLDLPRAEIVAHFDRTMELIAPLAPVLVHLRSPDVATALRATIARRGAWFEEFLQLEFGASARGRHVGRNDFAALVDYFAERLALSDELFARFPGRKLAHDNSDADWARQRRAIADFLGLPPMTSPPRPPQPEDFVGRYRAATGDQWTIAADAAGLHLVGDAPARLVPHGHDRFVIEGLCVEMIFRRATDGRVTAIECDENLPALPTRWARV